MRLTNINRSEPPSQFVISSQEQFELWEPLNDTIMGGSSQSFCRSTHDGLLIEGEVIEEGGGFISCRSPVLKEPLNLSKYRGIRVEVDGDGRTLKLAMTCRDRLLGLTGFISGGIYWVASIPTKPKGTTCVDIPFLDLLPTALAKPVSLPIKFNSSNVTQFQLLHSKFGQPGELNPGFKTGPIKILLRSISGFS